MRLAGLRRGAAEERADGGGGRPAGAAVPQAEAEPGRGEQDGLGVPVRAAGAGSD